MMLIRLDTGAVAAVDIRWQSFLDYLKVFRSLSDHAAVIVSRFPNLQGQPHTLEESLGQLIPRGLLYSADDVLAQLDSNSASAARKPKPLTLCIRTCDRPDALHRLLNSCAEHAKTFNHPWPIEILEDSRRAQHRSTNAALVENFSEQLTLKYIGFEQQEIWLASLVEQAPEDSEALHWLLDPQYPDNRDQPSHGRLYNLAFLRHAGERILMVDDDATLNAWRWPDAQSEPLFGLSGRAALPMPNVSAAQSVLTRTELDPIAAHGAVLGQPIATAIRVNNNNQLESSCLQSSMIESVPHPYARPGRIRYTRNGFLGDTGSINDQQYFYRLRLDAPALVLSAESYRRFRNAPRCAISVPKRPELLNGSHFHHTTCAGLDLSDLIPPVLPRGRNEDSLLGALLRFLYPQDFGMRLNFALEHRLDSTSTWQFGPKFAVPTKDAAEALERWINLLPAPAEITAAQRMQLLANTITGLSTEGKLSTRIASMLLQEQQQGAAIQFAITRSELSAVTAETPKGETPVSPQSPWRGELFATNQQLLSSLQSTTDQQEIDKQQAGRYADQFQRYAASLPAWQKAFERQSEMNGLKQWE
ncbi:hypothetical protein [Rhabdochromatium marinum]|uniref:hypothetical protein n=1 Tax=Rhabdochromatium marinum TaxID=48729 RepID=UPI00190374D2|nr:hypothetical protein [Rhabdochromatium marinum]